MGRQVVEDRRLLRRRPLGHAVLLDHPVEQVVPTPPRQALLRHQRIEPQAPQV